MGRVFEHMGTQLWRECGEEGDQGEGGYWGVKRFSWHYKCMAIALLVEETELIEEGIPLMEACPDPDEMTRLGTCFATHDHGHFVNCTSGIWVALAHERISRCTAAPSAVRKRCADAALAFAARTYEIEQTVDNPISLAKGAEHARWVHVLALRCRGRVFARARRLAESAAAYEKAIGIARLCGYCSFEAAAIEDMLQTVPDVAPAESGTRLATLRQNLPA